MTPAKINRGDEVTFRSNALRGDITGIVVGLDRSKVVVAFEDDNEVSHQHLIFRDQVVANYGPKVETCVGCGMPEAPDGIDRHKTFGNIVCEYATERSILVAE